MPSSPFTAARSSAYLAVVFTGAIFGFFYAWVCSTMWGLDAADPRVAIAAMQAMNASVRNAVFFPAFFLTPVLLAGSALLLRRGGHRQASHLFFAAAAVYVVAGPVLTFTVNVPMNDALATVVVPATAESARPIWDGYSATWQAWNGARAVLSGVSLLLAAIGLAATAPSRTPCS